MTDEQAKRLGQYLRDPDARVFSGEGPIPDEVRGFLSALGVGLAPVLVVRSGDKVAFYPKGSDQWDVYHETKETGVRLDVWLSPSGAPYLEPA